MKEKIINSYARGSSIDYIVFNYMLDSEQDVLNIIREFKEENKYRKTFTDTFKRLVAERDMNHVPRSTIASELEINYVTVKKFCMEFGQADKEIITDDQIYTRFDRELDLTSCPECDSDKVNIVEDNTTYCMNCGTEHVHYPHHVKKVNWDYIE